MNENTTRDMPSIIRSRGSISRDGSCTDCSLHHRLQSGEYGLSPLVGQEDFPDVLAPFLVLRQLVEKKVRDLGILSQEVEIFVYDAADAVEYVAVVPYAPVNEVHHRFELCIEDLVEQILFGPEIIMDQGLIASCLTGYFRGGGCLESFLQKKFFGGGQYV